MFKPSPTMRKLLVALGLAFCVLLVFALSGFTMVNHFSRPDKVDNRPAGAALVNAIKNGDFEHNPKSNVATYWQPYHNGQAHFGWYLEQWPEAVHSGRSSQLMEIFQVEGTVRNRVIAIYQTVNVTPNANYDLTIHALMRTDAPRVLRNKGEYAMDWGVDYSGEGKYYKVDQWVTMPISEQLRLGSAGPPDDNHHLFFQRITGTIFTANSSKITLFIRGVKVEPSGTEVNFNVDDVSLVGPYPIIQPTPTATTTESATGTTQTVPGEAIPASTGDTAAGALPAAGAILPQNLSLAAVALAGLVLVVAGVYAAREVLQSPKT